MPLRSRLLQSQFKPGLTLSLSSSSSSSSSSILPLQLLLPQQQQQQQPRVSAHRLHTTMAGEASATAAGAAAASKTPNNDGMREVRILMLHGYTQSGPLFHAKTRAVEKTLIKALAPLKVRPSLIYPTAPNRLSTRDIPGYSPTNAETADDSDAEMDAWAWFRKDEASGSYRLLEEGMQHIATAVREDGGGAVDGVVGFSQGGAVAAMVAAALEGERKAVISSSLSASTEQQQQQPAWLDALRQANNGKSLKFAVVYSGFFAPPADLQWLFEPKISTPTLHYIGSLDTVVEEGRSRALVARCEEPLVVVHPGGHYVPVSKEWVMPLIGFVRERCEDDADES
ncbi:serine hydrolase-domain-containing protein [Coniella lustricola]|uniref:Serine hydrolase-domain-containing protein n=1 Tax=Coniella lustricola TaxID=2025994 RepID=A0A2T3A9L7_9PEZI|nr:serine hydrolase-domain-containing protein [Coniella lustricola]